MMMMRSMYCLSFSAIAKSQFEWLSKITAQQEPIRIPGVDKNSVLIPDDEDSMTAEELLASLKRLQEKWQKKHDQEMLQEKEKHQQQLFAEKQQQHYKPYQSPKPVAKPIPSPTQQQHQQSSQSSSQSHQTPSTKQPQEPNQDLDLYCSDQWQQAKSILAAPFVQPSSTVSVFTTSDLTKLFEATSSALPQNLLSDGSQCGLVRLVLQMLSVVEKIPTDLTPKETLLGWESVDKTLKQTEPFHSPLMTVLVDIAWVSTINSGWPYFGLLGQWHLRNVNSKNNAIAGLSSLQKQTVKPMLDTFKKNAERDGLSFDDFKGEPILDTFVTDLNQALYQSGDVQKVVELSVNALKLLSGVDESVAGLDVDKIFKSEVLKEVVQAYPLAVVTAIAGTAVGVTDPQAKVMLFNEMQGIFKNLIKGVDDFSYAINTAYPLWSLLNLATLTA